MKVYKVTLMIVDHDGVAEGIKSVIENVQYPNRSISPVVVDVQEKEIGMWRDDNPLNYPETRDQAFERLFPPAQAALTKSKGAPA